MQTTQSVPPPLTTRPHFQLLDGLRGVAALAVLVFHFMEFVAPNPVDSFIGHGFLAVDFFFCLSGFVIGYAYDSRLPRIGVRTFLKLRLIRLQPLVVIGSVLGLLCFLADPYRNFYPMLGFAKTVWLFIASCLMLPYAAIPQRYNNIFHLNPPTWSLLWEYVASVVYALGLVRLPRKYLGLLTAAAAVVLCYAAHHYTNIGVGWAGENIAGGAVRVGFSFLMGLLVYRSGWQLPSRLGFIPLAILLLALLMVPFRPGLNQFTEPLIIIIGFPVLIAVAAATPLSATGRAVSQWLGNLSYPLYMLHYPFLWILYSYMEVHRPTADKLMLLMPLMGLGLIGFAHLMMVYVDRPIRTYLTRRFIGNSR